MGCRPSPSQTSRVLGSVLRRTWLLLLVLPLGGCRTAAPASRYIATVTPMNLLGPGHTGLCIAIDPADAQSAWWWEPGTSGCGTRSTGPTLFRVPATVAARSSGDIDVHFQLPLHVGERDVRLLLQDGSVRDSVSGARASTARRPNLDIPFAFGGG